MLTAFASLVGGVALGGCTSTFACAMVFQLATDKDHSAVSRWLRWWGIRGLLIPSLIWVVMNVGLSWTFPPFDPRIQALQNLGKPWVTLYLKIAAGGLAVVGTYWAAVTLAWVLWERLRQLSPDQKSELKSLAFASSLGMLVVAIIAVAVWGWAGVGMAVFALLAPVAAYAPTLSQPRKLAPMYSRAIAKLKFGKYSEAEWEIIHQLEEYEDDFNGWMMLASLYAEHFRDLPEAERTVLELCEQPNVNASQVSIAMHRLADWHLQIGSDPDAARRVLGKICKRMPGTHLAHMADLRMKQLPASTEEVRESRSASVIRLPALGDTLDDGAPVPHMEKSKAEALLNACMLRLKQDPGHAPSKEKMARLLAEELGRPERGIEELQELIASGDQPNERVAEWLSLIAAWHLRYRHDPASARPVLQRLVDQFPATVQAMAARRRLQLLNAEERARAKASLRESTDAPRGPESRS